MIIIRKATISDAPAITEFQQKMAMETEQLKLNAERVTKGVNAIFENPYRGQYYVADNKGHVIASLLMTFEWSDWRNANVWWFQSVYVLPEYRRTGIFRRMYLFIREEADQNGVAGLRLYVEKNNTIARKTYEALGMSSEHYTMYEWLKD